MDLINIVLSSFALLVATVSLAIALREKKRNKKLKADMVNYVEYECRAVKDDIGIHAETYSAKLEGLARGVRHKSSELDELKECFNKQSTKIDILSTKVDNLEKGIVPDYNEALKAKESVDMFNEGISNLLNYDPVDAAKKLRKQAMFGTEVE